MRRKTTVNLRTSIRTKKRQDGEGDAPNVRSKTDENTSRTPKRTIPPACGGTAPTPRGETEVSPLTLIPEYYQSLIRAAADDLRSLLWPENQDDAKTVQKGLILYRQGLVTNTRLEKDAATAVVHDVVPVHIKLDLHFFKKSTCSCPAKGICRHQLAAFFHIYSKVDSVSDWMEQWRLPLRTNGLPNIPGLKRAKDLLKQKEPQPDYDRWVANCIDAFHEVMPREETVQASEVYAYFHVYYRKIKTGAPVAREWRTLYFLIAALHSLHLLLLYSGEMNHSEDEVGRYYGPALSSLLDEAKEAAGILSIHSVPFAFDPFLEKLRADASFLLDDELGQRENAAGALHVFVDEAF